MVFTEICSFRLVLEGKTGKEILKSSSLEFLEVFSRQLCFIRCRRQYLWVVEWRRYNRFTFAENNIGNLPKVPMLTFLGSDGLLLAYESFAALRALLQLLLACVNCNFRFRRFILLVQMKKKWFLWTMAVAQAAENHGDDWGLTWYLQWGIYTSILTLTHSQNSLSALTCFSLS